MAVLALCVWQEFARLATGPASEVQAAGPVHGDVRHSEQHVAQFPTVDAVVPRLWLQWQLLAPLGARLVDRVIMVEVEVPQHPSSVGAVQVDMECVWATGTIQRPHTHVRLLHECLHVSVLVMTVCVLNKCLPIAVSEAVAHVRRQP